MDKIASLGTNIGAVIGPTLGIYGPLVVANASDIKKTERKTFQYGQHARQALDVYYPAGEDYSSRPVLLFCYGGGLVRGDKQLPMLPDGLVYANVGHFFAHHFGMQVVIPDYRLVGPPDVKYPSGGEDVGLAIEWIGKELAKDSPRQLFLMGNSAGGVHISTWLLEPKLLPQHAALKTYGKGLELQGIIMVGVPFSFGDPAPERRGVFAAYYGDRVEQDSPHGLLEALIAKVTGPITLIKTLIVTASLDPANEILEPNRLFIDIWPDKSRLDVLEVDGHNHISTALSLGTGIAKEEKWGHDVGKWVQETSKS